MCTCTPCHFVSKSVHFHSPKIIMHSTRDSAGTTFTEISQARKSLRLTTRLDREEFKGDKRNPAYAIDADVEGLSCAIERGDEDLTALELGKKYMDVFGEVDLVIADMSGTMFADLHSPLKPYPGVLEAFNLMKEHDIQLVMITNSWKTGKRSIVDLLNSGNFDVGMDDIFTSSDACKLYLREQKLQRPYYLVDESVLQDFADEFSRRPKEDVVIIGLPSTLFDYRLLSKGMELLINGAPLIALNMVNREESPNIRKVNLGPGPFVSLLSFSTDAEPVTICKPYREFYDILFKKYNCTDFSRVVLIGDDINEDIAGAKALGMKTILTRTGRYRVNDEKTQCAGTAPDATAETFAMAVRTVLASNAVSQMTEQDFIEEEKSSRGCGSESSQPREDILKKKMQGYLNADHKSKRSDDITKPLVKLPSYIW